MKISEIHFCNFKGFKKPEKVQGIASGLNESQNIVLFGGFNGAGKTSFLEGLFLCFYGRAATRLYPSRGARVENYEAFITALLNKEVKAKRDDLFPKMYIEVFLEDVELTANIPRNISVKRTWNFILNRDSVEFKSELFDILEDGVQIEEIEPANFEDRIQGILPYNVSQFFFFDGEKIQDFAADADAEFAASLKDILGINLYGQLEEDISKVRSRIVSDYNKNKDASSFAKEREAEKERLTLNIRDNQRQKEDLLDEIEELRIEKEKIDNETFRITRINANSREEYEAEKQDRMRERELLEVEYIEEAKEYLPFILSNNLFSELEQQLLDEERFLNWQSAQKEIEPKIDKIINKVFDDLPENFLTRQQRRTLEAKVDKAIRDFITNSQDDSAQSVDPIHNLSTSESSNIRRFLYSVNEEVLHSLNRKADRLKQIDIVLDKIGRTEVRSGGNSDAIQALFDKKSQIDNLIGQKEQIIRTLIEANDTAKQRLEILEREITNWEEKAELSEKHRKQIDYCNQLRETIDAFQKEFQAKRKVDLEQAIFEMWNSLTQKEKFIKRVEVLPNLNFTVKLYDTSNREIDKTKLSAGEKEIFAIALLWALVKVSGRNIPIVIDTPFGRLDSIHRLNIVKNYFPKASHQVILLSQDEEIVGRYYRMLKPYIAKEYTIKSSDGLSTVTEGYPFTEIAPVK